MKILIIGSEGTIGPHLYKCIREKHPRAAITRCDRAKLSSGDYVMADINYYETLAPAFDTPPELVFHLAGEVSRESGDQLPNKTIESNLVGLNNVIQYCIRNDSKLLFTSTSEVYGEYLSSGIPVIEKPHEDYPFKAKNIYGLTNFMGEQLVEYYHRMYGLKATIVRLFMSYGPGEYPGPYRSAVCRFIDWALHNQPIQVHRGGLRSHCYVEEMADGIRRAGLYENTEEVEVFNLGKDEDWDMEDVAKEICRLVNSGSIITYAVPHPSTSLIKRACFAKAKRVLNWEAEVSFLEGLKRTIEWQRELMK